jgi:hypothetical protein
MLTESISTHNQSFSKRLWGVLALLSMATLAFEINLSRLFSVQQFYHFAFMIVSIALLGFGASGTLLAIFPNIGKRNPHKTLAWLGLAASLSMIGAYLVTNWLPFDSFSIAWERRQVWILVLHYLALSTPFFFSGMVTGILLSSFVDYADKTYAANLIGSAVGCVTPLLAAPLLGGEGIVILSSGLAALAGFSAIFHRESNENNPSKIWKILCSLACLIVIVFALLDIGLHLRGNASFPWLKINISPYKSLSYALQFPDAEIISQHWNAFSRIDLLSSTGVRTLPGLSYRYLAPLPDQDGLFVDGDELTPVILPGFSQNIFAYTPNAVAYQLRPNAKVLILEPRGGLELVVAVDLGAEQILAVESNPLNWLAAQHIYNQPKVTFIPQSGRSFTRQAQPVYDLVVIPLTDSFHPVRSGAYSLSEDYRYTIQSFQDALSSLKADGLLVVTRWLQNPPSESLRTFALAITALENQGYNPRGQIVAFRSFNTITVIVKQNQFTTTELNQVREFCKGRAYDLVYAPDISLEDVNQFNVMPDPVYFQAFTQLLNTHPRPSFYKQYSYEVSPPTDEKPFFGHYFKWSQTKQVMSEFGKTWQPFGGAGYFVILALFMLASILSTILILLPAAVNTLIGKTNGELSTTTSNRSSKHLPRCTRFVILLYFALIGFGFLLVEIPLIQRFILFLGQPAYALTSVLFGILFFSGIGSAFSKRVKLGYGLGALVLLLTASPLLLRFTFQSGLDLAFGWRLALTVFILAPFGLLMGIAFPGGLYWADSQVGGKNLVPQIWAVNGASSVVASILAALLALSWGLNWVLYCGALCYLAACLIILSVNRLQKQSTIPKIT